MDSEPNIMSIGEMIDTAFGDPEVNIVNHKLIQTILFLLARQLRVLERRVHVEIGLTAPLQSTTSSLSVTEVKLHAMQKKKQGAPGKAGQAGIVGDKRGGKSGLGIGGRIAGDKSRTGQMDKSGKPSEKMLPSLSDKSSTTKTKLTTEKSTTDKTSSGKPTTTDTTTTDKTSTSKTTTTETSTDKTSSGKTTSDKTSTDKTSTQKSSTDKSSSDDTSTDKTSTEKSSTEKSSTEKSSTEKSSTAKSSTDKSSTEKSSTDKSSTEKSSTDKSSTDKSSTDKSSTEKSSTDKSSTDKSSTEKSSTDKSSTDKSSTEKSSTEKSSTEKPSTDKSSTEKSSTEKSSTEKSSTDKSSTEKSSSDKTSTEKSSSDKTSTEKTSTDKTSTEKSTTEPSTSEKSSSDKKAKTGKTGPEDYAKMLDEVELQREKILRIIHQRADSREERDKTPSPMASMDSMEATYEKLLVVERLPQDQAKALAGRERSGSRSKTPRVSVVTQEQFQALTRVVRQLQEKFEPSGAASFPENIKLMSELRKGASLTDAMAALQLSARLEATENMINKLMAMVTDVASKTSGVDMSTYDRDKEKKLAAKGSMKVLFGVDAKRSESKSLKMPTKSYTSPSRTGQDVEIEAKYTVSTTATLSDPSATMFGATPTVEPEEPTDTITHEEMHEAMKELYDELMAACTSMITKATTNSQGLTKNISKLEDRLNSALNLGDRMKTLENHVKEYTERINVLDTGLSAQMTNYQEELTQMQYNLEVGLDTMAEALANAGGDTTTAVTELNICFNGLQSNLENAYLAQEELKQMQNNYSLDLEALRKKIEVLCEVKSDRDEVADALRDKAGIAALNGLTSLQQFDAVRGDIEKKISAAFDKFNNQENVWQKIIDDILRHLNDKADTVQVVNLRDEIAKHLNEFRSQLNTIMDIVGGPRAVAVAKTIFRDTNCLSCATPARLLEEPDMIPELPAMRPPAEGAEAAAPKESGDHPCYPGRPIPHPLDPRVHVCRRWCGGSHTRVNENVQRAPQGVIVSSIGHSTNVAPGTDGKLYKVCEPPKPCSQCKIPASTPAVQPEDENKELESTLTTAGLDDILVKEEVNSMMPPLFD